MKVLAGAALAAALLCILAIPFATAKQPTPAQFVEARLLRTPHVSKDRLVFVYAGHLWIAAQLGGPAHRLTARAGFEGLPKFSPDGKWIAFTGDYDGNGCVYLVSADGGEPRRLTYGPTGGDAVLGWTPDGRKILFASGKFASTHDTAQLFLVSPQGEMAERLPLFRASMASLSPDGHRLAFLPTSIENQNWRHYRGGWRPPIGIFDLAKNTYEELPKSAGWDLFPMWHGNAIYFVSDRDGTMNLYRYDLGTKATRQLTDFHDFDIKYPSLGPDAIVFENGGLLYAFNLTTGKTARIAVTMPADALTPQPQTKDVSGEIGEPSIAPNGLSATMEAHGDIFTLAAKGNATQNITGTSGVHELDPVWSPDGKWIAYLSDRSGEYEIWLRPSGGGAEARVTFDGHAYRYDPVWSPDSTKLLFRDNTLRLWYVDVAAKKPVAIDRSEYKPIYSGSWSPDSRWVAFSKAGANGAGVIYLYSLDSGKSTAVTDSFYDSTEPIFDSNGGYLFFLSQRFFYPSHGKFEYRFNYYDTTGIFALALRDDERSAFEARAQQPARAPFRIDLDGIERRIAVSPITAGHYRALKARPGKLFFVSAPMETTESGLPDDDKTKKTLFVFSLPAGKLTALLKGIDSYDVDRSGTMLLYHSGSTLGIVQAAPTASDRGRLNTKGLRMRIDPRAEWTDVFHDAWRIERDFFWDPNMGGRDWVKIGKKYEALLPWVTSRDDLNYVMGQMIGELGTSHSYAEGGTDDPPKHVAFGALGVDYDIDRGFYRFKKIYRGENWNSSTRSPLTEPDLRVKEGDYLVAVNGRPAKTGLPPGAYFENLADKTVALTVNDKPSAEGARVIHVKPLEDETALRSFDWIESRRAIVDKASGGRVAYIPVPTTSSRGIAVFDKYLVGQLGKQAAIVDDRYNPGGLVADFLTEKLLRDALVMEAPRNGAVIAWPPLAIHGPKVLIANEQSGSGGDTLAWLFKHQKVGPLVGTHTYGALVGTGDDIPLLGGGHVTAPELGFWSNGQWIVENEGVAPDFEVEDRPDLAAQGRDPQLEKAIALVMDALQKRPPPEQKPAYPQRD